MNRIWPICIAFSLFIGCQSMGKKEASQPEEKPIEHNEDYVNDPHSFSNPGEAVTQHLNLELDVNFETKVLSGVARYKIARKNDADQIVFDIDSLNISRVTLNADESTTIYSVGDGSTFGQKLSVDIHKNTRSVNIYYSTNPGAAAVQWLSADQTLGKRHPFLFTQGQAILTRSWIPCQDSPGVRLTYDAEIKVPEELMAVMSAQNPQKRNSDGVYTFEMRQPVPPYLIALAVGNIEFVAVSENMGVYAEPQLLEAAAYEFNDMPRMLAAAESLYGPYRWDRYDLIVLPPSFPYGGMENPRLTFATPTIIAGDRSLTALVAHELAHSWSGNLVTNATWNDFWLNEGFTVYIEKRIMEELYGDSYSEMLNLLDYQDLLQTVDRLGKNSPLTQLKLDLSGKDPDKGMTDIAYEKGYHFLRVIEKEVGRDRFDAFLKSYFEEFAFGSVTTEMFIGFLEEELLAESDVEINVDEWIYGTGLPENIVVPVSDRFVKVEEQMKEWLNGEKGAIEIETKLWTTHEWLHFIRNLPEDLQSNKLAELDQAMYLTQSTNAEIQAAWYEVAILRGYDEVSEDLEKFLKTVGRRKFLMPLYKAMIQTEEGKEEALRIYSLARPNYHSVSVRSVDELLDFDPEKYKGAISL